MMAGAGGGGNARTVSYDDLEMRQKQRMVQPHPP